MSKSFFVETHNTVRNKGLSNYWLADQSFRRRRKVMAMMGSAKIDAGHEPKTFSAGAQKSRLMRALGPGLITGASDDDPIGIATYSQAGAQFSNAIAWTLLLTYPLMCATQ